MIKFYFTECVNFGFRRTVILDILLLLWLEKIRTGSMFLFHTVYVLCLTLLRFTVAFQAISSAINCQNHQNQLIHSQWRSWAPKLILKTILLHSQTSNLKDTNQKLTCCTFYGFSVKWLKLCSNEHELIPQKNYKIHLKKLNFITSLVSELDWTDWTMGAHSARTQCLILVNLTTPHHVLQN